VIVAVNKMDGVEYGEERFKEVRSEVGTYLRRVGFKPEEVEFVPISAHLGHNLTNTSSPHMPWYRGPSLLEALDSLSPPKQQTNIPLRMPIHDVYNIKGVGIVAVGRVETGILLPGCACTFAPSNITAQIQTIEHHHHPISSARPGDFIGFSLSEMLPSEGTLKRGDVASESKRDPARSVVMFVAQVVVLNHPGEVREGYTPVVDCHVAHVACRFDRIRAKINKRTDEVVEEEP
jgi:elongation factor 1-alpha